jgi:hypothetical protein
MGSPARVRADSPSVLRRINPALILEVIRAYGPRSRNEIACATGCPALSAVGDEVGVLGAVRFAMNRADERSLAFSAAGNVEEGAPTP